VNRRADTCAWTAFVAIAVNRLDNDRLVMKRQSLRSAQGSAHGDLEGKAPATVAGCDPASGDDARFGDLTSEELHMLRNLMARLAVIGEKVLAQFGSLANEEKLSDTFRKC